MTSSRPAVRQSSRLDSLKKFLREDPADSFTHYAIGLECVSLGRFDEALAKFREVITLDPAYVPAYQQLGLLLGRLKRRDEAIVVLDRGIEAATLAGDGHAADEMREAIEELEA